MKPPPLQLDFVRPPRRPLWLGLLLLAVAAGIATQLTLRWQDTRTELRRAQAASNLLNGERPRGKAPSLERLDDHVKAAEAVVRNLTLPWASLIETLESTSSQDVAVLQVQPDAQQGLLRITAEARNQATLWQYVRALAAAQSLEEVHLLNHQVQQEDPQKPLQFSVQAKIKAAL